MHFVSDKIGTLVLICGKIDKIAAKFAAKLTPKRVPKRSFHDEIHTTLKFAAGSVFLFPVLRS